MKYNSLMVILVTLLTFYVSSCKVNEVPTADTDKKQSGESVTITATLEMPISDTKTQISDETKVVWKTGDQIKVYSSSCTAGAIFTLVPSCDGSTTGDFTGYISGSGPYYAVYPASAAKSFSGTEISLSLPSVQTYLENSFASGASISVSYATALDNFAFKNLCGVLCLQLTGDNALKKIIVSSKGGELLNGEAKVDMSYGEDGTPSLVMTETGTSDLFRMVTLECSSASLSSTAKPFYIVVPSGALSSGFSVEIVDDEDYSMFKTAKASEKNNVGRSRIVKMPSFAYTREYNSAVQSQDYGFYTSVGASSTPSYNYKYEEGSQISFTTGDTRTFRLQNWDKEYAVTFSNIPSTITLGDSFNLYFKRMDNDIYDTKYTYYEVKVLRKVDSTLWLADENGNCFVLYIE